MIKKQRLKSALKWRTDFNLEFCSKTRHLLRFPLETSRCTLVAKALSYEIAFSATRKLIFSSLLKINEHLKSATEIALLILIRVFFKNSRFTARSRRRIKRSRKLKLPAVLNFKERYSNDIL